MTHKQVLSALLPVLGYGLVILLVFGPSLLPPSGMMIYGDDIHRAYYYYRQFFNQQVSQGVFPWWNPYLFGGEPGIANPIVNIWYPLNWLFIIFPLNIAYSWHLALHIFWASFGMYFLMRSADNRSRVSNAAAWVSGLIFGLSGFFMARTFAGHVDVIAAASWMPWVVGAFYQLMIAPGNRNFLDPLFPSTRPQGSGDLLRASTKHLLGFTPSEVEGKRSAKILFPSALRYMIIASAVFALQLISGYQTMAFFTVIAVGIAAMVQSIVKRSIVPMLRSALAGVGGIGLAAFHLLPVQEFFRASIRTYSFPYSWHSYGAIEWRSLIQFLNPFQFGNQYTYNGPPPNFIEHSAFIGIGGLVFAVIGGISILRRRGGVGIAFFLIVLFGLWVSLGPNAPFDLQYILWKIIPMYQYLRIPSRHLVLVVFGLAGLTGIGFGVLSQVRKSRAYLTVLITGIVVIEMVWFGRGFIELRPIPEARHDTGLIAKLKEDAEPYRVLQNFGVWLPPRDVLDFDSVMSYGIFSATGYDPSILRSYYDYFARSTGSSGEQQVLFHDVQVPIVTAASAEVMDRLNVKYILVPSEFDPFRENSRYALVRDDKDNNFRLYENTTVLPRFYFRDRSCGTPKIGSYTANRIVLTVDSSCDTTLMSSEVWYPGWEAYIDGKKSHIDKSNDVFRTLFVSKGKHTIIYRYSPRIFAIGALISILTATILFVWYKRRTVSV